MSAAVSGLPQVWATCSEREGTAGGKIGPASVRVAGVPTLEQQSAGRLHLVRAEGSAEKVAFADGTGMMLVSEAVVERVLELSPELVQETIEDLVPELTPEVVGELAPEPEMAFYRKYTEAMLRRYMRLSMAGGRLPSLLGRELFRGKVSTYSVQSFDDIIIYVKDVEQCLGKLDGGQQELIRRIALQGYTYPEAARLLRLNPRTAVRRYNEALDELTTLFLERQLLKQRKSCQGVREALFPLTAR